MRYDVTGCSFRSESLLRAVAGAVVLVVGGGGVVAQAVQPSARYAHSMAYDSVRDRIVLFGGNSNNNWPGGALGDTWEWDGQRWEQRTPATSPSPRGHAAMVYDSVRQRCLLFGGYINGWPGLNETWEWDGSTWVQRSVPGPGARGEHNMVYADHLGKVVLFGGYNGGVLGDTWLWDGSAWAQQVLGSNPGPHVYHGMTYDPLRQQVVLFGGNNGATLGDTWTYDGTTWALRSPSAAPSGRHHPAMCFLPGSGKVSLFGGFRNNANLGDTWDWDGTTWTQVSTTSSPPARHWVETCYAYHAGSQRGVLFGGWNVAALGDTWKFDGANWTPAIQYTRSPINGHLYGLTPPMSWTQAEAVAQAEGGHLATVRSAAENTWLRQAFSGTRLWIGFSDAAVEGQWSWASGEPVTYANWGPGEPNNVSNNEHCCEMVISTGLWNDAPFAYANLPGIIELPGGPTAPIAAAQQTITSTPPPLTSAATAPLPNGGSLTFGGTTSSGPNSNTYTLSGTTWAAQYPLFSPATRTDAALMLDRARANNVLFGGKNPVGNKLGDTWLWTSGQWSYVPTATAPSARSGHALAYDPVANLGLLFGGEDAASNPLGDFWAWNGTAWTQLSPATLPTARFGHEMAFDEWRGRMVLFGGRDASGRLDDVWEWDGTNWTDASAAVHPTARHGAAMAWDPIGARMLLVAGRTASGLQGDVWQLAPAAAPLTNELVWSQLAPTSGLPARNSAAVAYDSVRSQLVVYGGYSGTGALGDTWTFDGTTWTQQSPATLPPLLNGNAMVFDSARGRAVMFGGFNSTTFLQNGTWEWDGTNWSNPNPATRPSVRMFVSMAYDSQRQRTVLFGGQGPNNANLGDTWEYDGINWTQVASTGPSPRAGAGFCYDPVRGRIVLVGGRDASGVLQETWTWDGATWTQTSPTAHPAGLLQPAVAFDPTRGKVVLFGGANTGWATNYDQTWEWNGTDWAPTALERADGIWNPGPRDSFAMAYDPRGERVVIHGGESASGCAADVWSWDGTEWTLHVSTGTLPTARGGHSLWHDSGANELRLFAGGCGTTYANDLWSLTLPVTSRWSSYGQGCPGFAGVPNLAVRQGSEAILGQTFVCDLTNVPTTIFNFAFGMCDLQRSSFLGQPIPVNLGFAGLPGCQAWTGGTWSFTLPPMQVGVGTSLSVPLPNASVLLGASLYLQALVFDNSNGRWASVSNGVEARIGDR